MLKQPPALLVCTVATVRAPEFVLQVLEYGGSAQARRSGGEAQTDVGGGKTEAAAVVRVVGRGAIVPPSHAGVNSISQITYRVALATKRRMLQRYCVLVAFWPTRAPGPGQDIPRRALATALP